MSLESALSYAALILADSEIEISADKLTTLVEKANVEVESIWADLFAKALAGKDLKSLFFNISSGPASGGSAPAASAGGAASAEVEEEKEEAAADESDDEMGFGLFD